jgi:hypothetical protein
LSGNRDIQACRTLYRTDADLVTPLTESTQLTNPLNPLRLML